MVLYADDAPPKKVLLLKECINIAIQNNTTIKAAEEDKQKAMADYRVALAQRLFFIDVNIKTDGYTKTNFPTVHSDWYQVIPYVTSNQVEQVWLRDYFDKYVQPQPSPFVKTLTRDYDLGITTGVTASVSLYNEKKAQNQALAKTNLNIYKIQNKKAIQDVVYSVKNAYCTYLMASETVATREKMLKSNKDKFRMTEILYNNAQKSILDLSRAQYDFKNSEVELQKAKNGERAARTELLRIMGIDEPGMDFNLEDFNELPEVSYSLEQLNKLAEDNFPDLQLVKMQTQLYKTRVDLEKAGHYPEVDFQVLGGLRNSRLDFTSFKRNFYSEAWKPSIGVNFVARIPIFSSGMVMARVDSANAEYNKAKYKEKDVTISTRTLIVTQYQSLLDLKKQIEMSKQLKEDAEKHLLLAKKSYQSGTGTQVEINEAIMSFDNAEMSYQKAKYDYLMAVAKISSIVGLGEDSLCKK